MKQLVVFSIEKQQFALRLSVVKKIIRAVEIIPLPNSPEIILGTINIHGKLTPVISVRKRLGLKEKEINLNDHLIIASISEKDIALLVDNVRGVIALPEQKLALTEKIITNIKHPKGTVKLTDGTIFICNLEEFISLKEKRN